MEKIILLYKKNTQIVYSMLLLIGSAFIVFKIFLPIFSSIGSLRAEVSEIKKQIDEYKNSETVLRKLDNTALSHHKDMAIRALPFSKDIQAVSDAINQSAKKTNISVASFSIKIGDVFKKGLPETSIANGTQFLVVNLLVSQADPKSFYVFSQELLKHMPLSRIMGASITSGEGDMDIAFYYKPIDVSFIDKNVIKPFSSQDLNVLKSLPTP